MALIASGGFAAVAQGADHRDGPLSTANPTADITDVYAFRSPADNNNLVVAINVNPLIVPTDNGTRGVLTRQCSISCTSTRTLTWPMTSP